MAQAVEQLERHFLARPSTILICPWAEQGAAGRRFGRTHRAPAFPPPQVKDTLAAGDTFIAACLHLLLGRGEGAGDREHQLDLGEVLRRACLLAGRKVGQHGKDGLDLSGVVD